MRLILLPNGDAIRPDAITAVRLGDAREADEFIRAFSPRVIVDFGEIFPGYWNSPQKTTVVNFPDNASRDAYAAQLRQEIADALAQAVQSKVTGGGV